MSLETWKAEFYPTPADENISSDIIALEHSLKKWKGLTSENLTKHQIRHVSGSMVIAPSGQSPKNMNTVMWITGDTCALCQRYMTCAECPINGACDDNTADEFCPYDKFVELNNPYPMIERLEQALKEINQN